MDSSQGSFGETATVNGESIAVRRVRDEVRNALRQVQDVVARNDELGRTVPGLVWELGTQLTANMEELRGEVNRLIAAVRDDDETGGDGAPSRRAATMRRQIEAFDKLLASQSAIFERLAALERLVPDVDRLASGAALSTDIDGLNERVEGIGRRFDDITNQLARLGAATASHELATTIRQDIGKLGGDVARHDHIDALREDVQRSGQEAADRHAALEAELDELRKEVQALRRRIAVQAKAPVLQLDEAQIHQITRAVLTALDERDEHRAGGEGEGGRRGLRRR